LWRLAAMTIAFTACNSGTETKSDAKTETTADSATGLLQEGEEIYQCPMHPEETSDKPPNAPNAVWIWRG